MVAVFMAAVFTAAEGIADNPEAKRLARRIFHLSRRSAFDHGTILQRQPPHDFAAYPVIVGSLRVFSAGRHALDRTLKGSRQMATEPNGPVRHASCSPEVR